MTFPIGRPTEHPTLPQRPHRELQQPSRRIARVLHREPLRDGGLFLELATTTKFLLLRKVVDDKGVVLEIKLRREDVPSIVFAISTAKRPDAGALRNLSTILIDDERRYEIGAGAGVVAVGFRRLPEGAKPRNVVGFRGPMIAALERAVSEFTSTP
jgi:hypothetical protein